MLDEGKDARHRSTICASESASLLAQRIENQKELVGKQAQIEILDKAIMAKDQALEAEHPGCSSARAF